MNRYLTLLFCFVVVAPAFPQFRYAPDRPKIDGVVSITYTPTGTLAGETAVQAVVLRYGSPTQMRLSQPETTTLTPVGTSFAGTIKIPFKEVAGLLVAFQSKTNPARIDHNNAHFYSIPLYGKTGVRLPHAQGGLASVMMRTSFPYLLRIKPDWAWAVEQYERELAQHPALRSMYWADLVRARIREGEQGQQPDYRQTCLNEISAYLNSPPQPLTPADLKAAAELYTYLKEPQLAQSARARIRRADHSTPEAQQARIEQLKAEPELGRKRAYFDDYVATFPRSPYRGGAVSALAEAYFKAGKLRELVDFMGAEGAAETDPVLLLNFAHQLAIENRDIPQAGWLANRVLWAFGKRPLPPGNKALAAVRANQIRQAQSIQAHALDQLGQYGHALTAYRTVWTNVPPKQTDPATNERIWLCAQKAGRADSVWSYVVAVLRAGRSTNELRNRVRTWQTARMGDARELAAYTSNMALIDESDRRAALTDRLVDEPAPPFTLSTLDGRRVSLASLRGKVVVLDFWATWCEPCQASLSAKRQVRDQFRRDPGVQFLFVNTQENQTPAGVRKWLARQPGLGSVPLDTDRKMAAVYGVKLLPTSIVIAPNGRVRYRSAGYSDNPEATADELTLAIEAVKE